MMMMAEGILGTCSNQLIEGVTVKVESDAEDEQDDHQLQNNHRDERNGQQKQFDYPYEMVHQEVVETVTVPHIFSSHSAACANCSISFFDPVGNEVYQRIFFMCLDKDSNEAIQISSAIHILFARKLSRCLKPSVDLALCSKCAELVAKMYQLYRELDELSAVNAYINSFLSTNNNISDIYSSSSESNTTSSSNNYAHYEESIAATVRASCSDSPEASKSNSDCSTPVDQISTAQKPVQNRVQKRLSEPPPLAYPSYFVPSRGSNAYSSMYSQEFTFSDVQVKSENLSPNNVTNSPRYADLHSQPIQTQHILQQQLQIHLQQQQQLQLLQQQQQKELPQQQQEHTTKNQHSNSPVKVDKKMRVINCTEVGCPKVYHGKGAKASLRQHVKIVHLKQFPFLCPICDKPISTRNLLDAHAKTHWGAEEKAAAAAAVSLPPPHPPEIMPLQPQPPPSNSCHECGKVFSTAYILSVHVKRHHSPGMEIEFFHCQVNDCTRKFKDKSSLRRHEHSHESPNNYSCTRCPERFVNRKLLKEHQIGCPLSLDQKQFLCMAPSCKRRFKYKHHLQNHYMFQHKLTAEEAREQVYPGRSVRDWMTSPRKRNPKTPSTQMESSGEQGQNSAFDSNGNSQSQNLDGAEEDSRSHENENEVQQTQNPAYLYQGSSVIHQNAALYDHSLTTLENSVPTHENLSVYQNSMLDRVCSPSLYQNSVSAQENAVIYHNSDAVRENLPMYQSPPPLYQYLGRVYENSASAYPSPPSVIHETPSVIHRTQNLIEVPNNLPGGGFLSNENVDPHILPTDSTPLEMHY